MVLYQQFLENLERRKIGYRKVAKIMPKYVENRDDDFDCRTYRNYYYDQYAVKNRNKKPRVNL